MIDGLILWMLMLLGMVTLVGHSGRSRLLLLLTWLAIVRGCNFRLPHFVLPSMLRRMMIGTRPQEVATGNIHTTGAASGVLLTKNTGNLGLRGTGATRLLIGTGTIGMFLLPDGRHVMNVIEGRVSPFLLLLLPEYPRPHVLMMDHHVH